MAKVLPFRGFLYNPDKVSGDEVIAPPYDIISPGYREVLYRKSPYNIVRIDFGRGMPEDTEKENKYTRACSYFEQWVREGVLVRDDKPAYYAYEIDYALAGEGKKLRGILAMVKIEELGKGVYPHEATHSKPKADRLDLMRACFANISPVYALYNSPEKIASGIVRTVGTTPYFSARDTDGAVHKLYKISGTAQTGLITKELYDKPVFIADGHHRYEVALEFKREMDTLHASGKLAGEEFADGSHPWDYVLMFLANMSDDGISILPTHRLVKGIAKEKVFGKLEKDFHIRKAPLTTDILEAISKSGKDTFGFFMDGDEHWHILEYKGDGLKDIPPALKDLDVVVLHELILKRDLGITDIAFEMDVKEATERVRRKEFDGVFFLNPTGVDDVERVALSQLRMPPKSTYFYPKLLTGMVINSFKN